jgi:hypothetical protein
MMRAETPSVAFDSVVRPALSCCTLSDRPCNSPSRSH